MFTERRIYFDLVLVSVSIAAATLIQELIFLYSPDALFFTPPFMAAALLCALFAETMLASPLCLVLGIIALKVIMFTETHQYYISGSENIVRLLGFLFFGFCSGLIAHFRIQNLSAKSQATEKDRLLAEIVHDLRSPLHSVNLSLCLLQQLCKGTTNCTNRQNVARVLNSMEASLRRQNSLVESLMDANRLVEGKLELKRSPCDLNLLATNAEAVFAVVAERSGIQFVHDLFPAPVPVLCDQNRILRVIGNLIDNAIKYTDKGGVITILVRREDQCGCLKIMDTGSGIPATMLHNIFEQGVQVNPRGGGIGYGLAVAKKIVDLHDGSIAVKSQEGVGTEFTIRLPLYSSCRELCGNTKVKKEKI